VTDAQPDRYAALHFALKTATHVVFVNGGYPDTTISPATIAALLDDYDRQAETIEALMDFFPLTREELPLWLEGRRAALREEP